MYPLPPATFHCPELVLWLQFICKGDGTCCSSLMSRYSFCHSQHLSYPYTHFTLPHKHYDYSCSLQAGYHKATQFLDSAPIQVMHGLFVLVKQPILPWTHICLAKLSQYTLLRFFFWSHPLELIKEGSLLSKCPPEPIILPNNFLLLCHPLTK